MEIKNLIKVETPKIPEKWDYQSSVERIKASIYKWKNLTIEIIQELWIANQILASPGARTDLKPTQTWESYCKEIGIDKRTVNRWLQTYLGTNVPRLETPELPLGQFQIILADPPWQFRNIGFEESAQQHYPTMSVEEISALKIPVEKEAVLFLWVVNTHIKEALQVCEAWGFEYKTNMVWIKNKGPSIGWFTRSKHELLFIATKGEGIHPQKRIDSWFQADATKHSKKPKIVYEIIEKMYPNQKYLELFARNKEKRNNWTYWGKEALL